MGKMVKIVYDDGFKIRTYVIDESEYEFKPVPSGYIIKANNENVFIPTNRIIRIVTRHRQ